MTGIPIYDLRLGQCKFAVTPFDAPKHLFCAEPVEYEGCPYCAEHAARCFDRRAEERKKADALKAAVARAAKKAENALRVGPKTLSRRDSEVIKTAFDHGAVE